jgi:spore coat polysaccharide biosynthesis protein SpsF
MKTGILITARLGSTRLKRKHLLPVLGHPILYYLLSEGTVEVFISTSDEPENRAFEQFSDDNTRVFYGSKSNIPLRHLQTADTHCLDSIIAVDGDDILCSVNGMQALYQFVRKGGHYVKTSGLPFGMNSMGYSRSFLETSVRRRTKETLETGWGRIFDTSLLTDIVIALPVKSDALRFTLDYEEDYRFFTSVIELLGDKILTAQDEEIVHMVLENRLHAINESISEDYWRNFRLAQEMEHPSADTGDRV